MKTNQRKSNLRNIGIIISLAVVLVLSGTLPQTASAKSIELRLAHMFPMGSPHQVLAEAWAKKIAEDSNGQLTIRIFPVGTLIPPPQLYDAAAMGTADICFGFRYMPKGYTLGVTFPFIIGAPDVETGTKVYDDIWKKFPKLMAKEWSQVKILWLTSSMPQFICTNKPVRRLEDMKGLQLRVPSKELGDLMKDLGATPVFMSTADYTVALEKGTVDGGTTQPSAIHENKLAGRINYLVAANLGTPTPVFVIMNKDAYNDLPKELQKVIDQNMDYGKQMTLDIWIEAFDKAKKYFAENGVEIVTLSDEERARWTPIVDNARARVGADLDKKGLPGTEIVNYIKERVDYYAK